MSYMALYRKFRPQGFQDVKGQEALVRTLKNQIQADRIGHAYLFCGTRGTGKTTVAKIFAKAVNCEHPREGSPCGACSMCREIGEGSSMNVIEIDAASNNGVDNIREIREEVSYRPAKGKYKVYIIDEVHMLSAGAFNALLKTLEEPPEYVIFILATTEVHKIPVTILSRCQRYDFRRIDSGTIAERLQELVEKEGLQVEEKAIRYIARMGDGSMRDALSLLDQCTAFYLGEKLTYEHVLEVLGAVDQSVFGKLLEKLLAAEVKGVIQTVEELVLQGRELTQMTIDFTWYLRNLLLVTEGEEAAELLEISAEQFHQLQNLRKKVEDETLFHYIRVFSELSNQMKFSGQKRILLEMALIRLCRPEMEKKEDALWDRLRRMEQRLTVVEEEPSARPVIREGEIKLQQEAQSPRPALPEALTEEVQYVAKNFREIIQEASPLLRICLKKARLSAGEGNLLLVVMPSEVEADAVRAPERLEELSRLLEEKTEKQIRIDVRQMEKGRRFEDSFVDIEQQIHMELTIEEQE